MALSIPPDYGRRVRAGRPVSLQIIADGTDANSTNVAMGYARALVAERAHRQEYRRKRRALVPKRLVGGLPRPRRAEVVSKALASR